jgi:MOB kinase activator 1
MTSFIQTMFVQHSPPQSQFPHSPKPAPAIQSNVLAESESYPHLPLPSSPESVYQSSLQRHIHTFFSSESGSNASTTSLASQPQLTADNGPGPRFEDRFHEPQRGLGHGLGLIGRKANLFVTRSNSNARNRQTFQSQKRAKGSSTWQLKQFADATLGGNSLRKCVQLPEGEDRNEWLAVNGTSPTLSFPSKTM